MRQAVPEALAVLDVVQDDADVHRVRALWAAGLGFSRRRRRRRRLAMGSMLLGMATRAHRGERGVVPTDELQGVLCDVERACEHEA